MNSLSQPKNILITGGGRRIGAEISRYLHRQGGNIIIHYQYSAAEAKALCTELNTIRPDSALALAADLNENSAIKTLAQQATDAWGGIDALVNNASSFYPTDFAEVDEEQWQDLLGSNLKAPFFLAQALRPSLKQRRGCIVNLIDIHAERGLKGFPVYSIAKAGLAAMTKVLAKELGPEIRSNGVAPGAVLWPELDQSPAEQQAILDKTQLQRCGRPEDIAQAVDYLIHHGDYVTGQIIAVDGGRTLNC